MKKTKRVLAIIGVIILVCMYLSTLVFAFLDRSASLWLLKSSVAATLLLPVLLHAYNMFYKFAKKNNTPNND